MVCRQVCIAVDSKCYLSALDYAECTSDVPAPPHVLVDSSLQACRREGCFYEVLDHRKLVSGVRPGSCREREQHMLTQFPISLGNQDDNPK